MVPYYSKVGRAPDLKDPKERKIFRALEIFPGALSWLTLLLIVLLSWLKPAWASIIIICFIAYWIFQMFFLFFHTFFCYKKMKERQKANWLGKLTSLPAFRQRGIYHLIVFPIYKESLQVIRESFQSLADSDYPKNRMITVLACEERGGEEAKKVAQAIDKEFRNKFYKLLITFHPEDIPGEITGKGANETWGLKKAKELIVDRFRIPYENIIISSFDADTCVPSKYFSCLTYHYLTNKNSWKTGFQPIPLFVNNIREAFPVSRIFALWATVFQMVCQEIPARLVTFSSHSAGFKSLVDVDFCQTNVVSDDSRIFWQCFLRYNGDFRVIPLHYPVFMDANIVPGFLKTVRNIYKQQRRWAYGAGDIPYLFFGFLKNKKISLSKKISFGGFLVVNHWAWATNSIVIFFLGWLPLVLGGEAFSQTPLSVFTGLLLAIAAISFAAVIYFVIIFSLVLSPPKLSVDKKRKSLFLLLELLLTPAIMMLFISLPALDAQTRWILSKYMGFWVTPKTRG